MYAQASVCIHYTMCVCVCVRVYSQLAGVGSRFEGSTVHSMAVRGCPLCRWDGGKWRVRRNEAWGWGGGRWKSERNESSSSEVCLRPCLRHNGAGSVSAYPQIEIVLWWIFIPRLWDSTKEHLNAE